MDTRILALELGGVVLVYAALAGRNRRWPLMSTAAFLSGVAVLAIALVSPVHGLSERVLSWHMAQHVLIVSLAAPLLASGRPIDLLLARGGRRRARREVGTNAVVASAILQVGGMLAWHVPTFFDAAVRHPQLHEAEHATMLLTAFVFWDTVIRLDAAHRGGAVVALFVVTLPAMAYGVALTLARTPWYETYRAGDALSHQQLAGVVMWAYGGLAAVVGGVTLGVAWMRSLERSSPSLGPVHRGLS